MQYRCVMNNQAIKTYDEIYRNPLPSNIKWDEIEKMLVSFGAKIMEGNGSRVRIELNGVRAVFHRPHPENTADKGAVKSVRKLLENAGVILR